MNLKLGLFTTLCTLFLYPVLSEGNTCLSFTSSPRITNQSLPQPSSVVIDFLGKRILFAVQNSEAGSWPVVNHRPVFLVFEKKYSEETLVYRTLNENRLKWESIGINSTHTWIDVTTAIRFSKPLFDILGEELLKTIDPLASVGLSCTNCHRISAILNEIETAIKFSSPQLKAEDFLNEGFLEVYSPSKADLAIMYLTKGGQSTPIHSYTIFPGTKWVIAKEGSGTNAIAARSMQEVVEFYTNQVSSLKIGARLTQRYLSLPN